MQFIGGDPIDLSDVNILKQGPYHVAPKIDGIRYLLYKKNENEKPFVVSRRGLKLNFPLPNFNCNLPSIICKTYILDIEKVDKKYYILDALKLDGIDLIFKPFIERYSLLKTVLNLNVNSNFELIPYFPWFPKIKFENIVQNYPIDGLIFVPTHLPYRSQKFRWKFVNTIDFQALSGGFLGVLVGKDNVIPFRIGKYNIHFNGYPLKRNDIYEFRFDLISRKWFPICKREDKKKPNRLQVARFILFDIILKQHKIQPFEI